ncbi:MAG: hypothetical protein ACSLEM_06680 [Candidatus Malihini olakiniferum]
MPSLGMVKLVEETRELVTETARISNEVVLVSKIADMKIMSSCSA